MRSQVPLRILILLCVAILFAGIAPRAAADDDDDPSSRVARLSFAQGSVSFQPAGTDDWVTAVLNRPITTGDQIWTDRDGRLELQLDGSLIRLSNNTGFSFLNLSDNVTQIQLTSGTLLVRVRRIDPDETYEIDTPNLAFSIHSPGLYRISVNDSGDSTAIKIRSGEGEVTGEGAGYTLGGNDSYTFSGTDQLYAEPGNYGNNEDQFDRWASDRDRRWESSQSSQYVSPDVVGYEDLDDNGQWQPAGEYGNVWFPRTSAQDWAPYRYGHWAYIEPWGYTWVDDESWGYAPFHYGRWVSYRGRWGWVPAPPRVQGVVYVRPVYAPALVAWVGGPHFAVGVGVGGGGTNVGWFPLGPREVYVPSYRVSRNYVDRVNVSNTRVTTVVVNNYYNTTIENKHVTNVKYVNQGVRGAVTATTPRAFTSAQSVSRNTVRVDQREVERAPVRAFTPAEVPAKQAVLGSGAAAARPPATFTRRAVVAKVAPPPPPPSFEKRQEAIKNNGGKPLSAAQARQIQPAAAHREAPVKIAPAAKTVTPAAQANRPGHRRIANPLRPQRQTLRQTPGTSPPSSQTVRRTRTMRPLPPNRIVRPIAQLNTRHNQLQRTVPRLPTPLDQPKLPSLRSPPRHPHATRRLTESSSKQNEMLSSSVSENSRKRSRTSRRASANNSRTHKKPQSRNASRISRKRGRSSSNDSRMSRNHRSSNRN